MFTNQRMINIQNQTLHGSFHLSEIEPAGSILSQSYAL